MSITLPIKFAPENTSIQPPAYQTAGAAGFDLRADLLGTITLDPGQRAIIHTGIYVAVPRGYELQIRPRSGLAAKDGITVLNSPGTIDSDYRGEIKVILANLDLMDTLNWINPATENPDELYVGLTINPGDRIAQAVLCPIVQPEFDFVDQLDETERGTGGFGSTGRS